MVNMENTQDIEVPQLDPIDDFHKALVAKGYKLPDIKTFRSGISDPERRKKLYTAMVNEGDYTKSYNDFDSQFFASVPVKKKETTSPVSSHVAPQLTKPSVPIQNSFGIETPNTTQETQSIVGGQQVTPSSSIATNQSQYGWSDSPNQTPVTPQYATTAPFDQASDQYRKDVKEKDLAKQSTSAEFTNTLLNPNSPLIQNKSLFAQSLVRETKPEEQAMIQQNFSNLKPEYQQDIANYLAKVQVDNPNKHAELVSRIGENGLDQKAKATILSQATNDRLQKAARDFSILEARNKQGKEINPNDAEKAIGEYNQSINDMSQVLQQFPEEIDRLRKVKAQNDEMTIKDSDSFLVKAAKQTGALLGGVQNSILDGAKSTLEWARDISDQLSGEQDTRGLTDKAVEGIGNFLDSWHAATPTKYKDEKDLQGENAGGAQEFIAQLGAQFGNMGMLYALGAGSKARLVTAGAATSYSQYYDEADKTGKLSKDGVQKYALFQSTIQGLLELVNPNFGAAEFEKVGLKSGIEFLKNNPNANVGNYVKNVFKETIGENAQELTQNTGGVLGKVAANALIGKDVFDPSMTAEEQMQTVTMTTATTLLASFITKGRFRDYHRQSLDFLRNIPEAKLIGELNQQVQDGNLTYTQADKIKTLVNDKENTPVVEGEKQVAKESPTPSVETPKAAEKVQEVNLESVTKDELLNESKSIPTPSEQTKETPSQKRTELEAEDTPMPRTILTQESVALNTAPTQDNKEQGDGIVDSADKIENAKEVTSLEILNKDTEKETPDQRKERVNRTILDAKLPKNTEKAVVGVINNTKDAKLFDVLPKAEKAKAQKLISDIYAEDKKNAPVTEVQPEAVKEPAKAKPKTQLQKGQAVGSNNKNVAEFEPTSIKEEIEQHLASGGKINEQDFKDFFGDGKGGTQAEMAKWKGSIDPTAPSLDQVSENFKFKEGAAATDVKNAFQEVLSENGSAADVRKNVESKHKERKATLEGKNNPFETPEYEANMKALEAEKERQQSKKEVTDEEKQAYHKHVTKVDALQAQAEADPSVKTKHDALFNKIANDPQYQKADGSFDYEKLSDNVKDGFEPDLIELTSENETDSENANRIGQAVKSVRDAKTVESGRDNEGKQGDGERGGNERGLGKDKASSRLELDNKLEAEIIELNTKIAEANNIGDNKLAESLKKQKSLLQDDLLGQYKYLRNIYNEQDRDNFDKIHDDVLSGEPISLPNHKVIIISSEYSVYIGRYKLLAKIYTPSGSYYYAELTRVKGDPYKGGIGTYKPDKTLTEGQGKKKFTQASRGSRAAFVQKGITDVLNQVKKAFPKVEVISDQTEIDNIKAANPELAGDRGFVHQGKVYLDLSLADPTTPLHEFAHIWIDLLEKVNPPQFNKAKELIQGTVYHTQAKAENPTKSENDLAKEAMVRAIEADGVRALSEGKVKQAVTKVKDWLRNFFNIPPTFNVSKMTLEDFVRQANRELLRGTPLTQSSSLDIDNLLKNKSSNEFVVSNSVMSKRSDERSAKFIGWFREYMLLKGNKLGVPFQNRIRNAEAKEKAKVARYADLLRRWKTDLLSDARELSEADAADLMIREAEVFNGTRVIADLPPNRRKNMENLIEARKDIQRAFLDNMEAQGQVVINQDLNPLLTANYELQEKADNRLDEINKEYDALFEKVKGMTDPAAIKAELDNIQRKSQALKLQILSDKLKEVKGALTLIKDRANDLSAQNQAFLNEIRDLEDSIGKIQRNGSAALPSPTAYTDIIKRTQKAIKNQEKLNENVSEKAKQASNFPILEAEVQRLKDELELLLESDTAGDFKTKVLKEIDKTRNFERKVELNKVKQKDTVEIRFRKKADGTFDLVLYQRDGTKLDAKDVTERDLRNMIGLIDANIDAMIDNTEGYLPIKNPQVLLNNPLYEKVRKNDNYTRRSYMKHHEELNAQNIKEKIGQQAYDEGVKAIRKMYETPEMTAIRVKNTEGGETVYTFLNESGVESAEMSINDLKKFLQSIDVSAAQIRAIETHIADGKLDWFKFNGTKGRYAEHGVTFTLSKDQESQILNDFLANENKPLEGGASSKKGLDTTMLKKRQNISPELRGLMGEYTDPIVVATRTIMDAAITQQKDKYHQMLLSEGMGTLFLTEPNERTGHTVKLSKNEMGTLEKMYDEKGNPISVLYTTEELYDGLLGSTAETAKKLRIWGLSDISGYTKMLLTVLSVDSRTRDKLSNFFRLFEMGNIAQVKNYFEATRVANADMDKIDIKKSDFKDKRVGHIAKELITKGIPQSFNIVDSVFRGVEAFRGNQYGNVENPRIEALLQEAREFDLVDGDIATQDIMQGSTVMEGNSWVKQGLREAGKTYQKADAATKILFYWGEKQKMLARGMSEQQAKEAAAANVRLLVPDYSITPKVAKILAVTPAVGNFIMYKTESFRTYTNGWKLAVSEIVEGQKNGNKAQVRQGAGRVASLSTAIGIRYAMYKGLSHLVMSALRAAFDWDDEKDTEALRKLQPDYAKNSQFIVFGKKDNVINVIDFSFTDPEGDIFKMAIAAMRGGSIYEKFVGASKEFLQGYTDADIALKSIFSIYNNSDAYGGKIRNTQDDIIGQGGKDVADYLFSVYTPKFITSASKVYNAALLDILSDAQKPSGGVNTPTIGNEISNILLGVKTKKIDMAAMYKRAMQAEDTNLEEAQRKFEGYDKTISDVAKTWDYMKMIFTGETQKDKNDDKLTDSIDLVEEVFNNMLPKYQAASQLGLDPNKPIRNGQLVTQLTNGTLINPMFNSYAVEKAGLTQSSIIDFMNKRIAERNKIK